MAKDNKLVKKENDSVATINSGVPEHLREYQNMGSVGFENVKAEDTIVPRLAIAQAISPQVTKGDPSRIEGLEVGQFFNTLTEEIYGDEVNVTPLMEFPNRIFFPPRGSNDAIICSANKLDADGRLVGGHITPEGCDLCPRSKFLDTPRPDGSTRPDCTLFYNYPVAVHTQDGLDPAVFSAKSKMIKPAKKLNSLVRFRKPPMPGFTMILKLGTVPQKAAKGTFFNVTVNNGVPKDVSVELLPQTKMLYEMFSNTNINVDMRGVDKELEFEDSPTRDDM